MKYPAVPEAMTEEEALCGAIVLFGTKASIRKEARFSKPDGDYVVGHVKDGIFAALGNGITWRAALWDARHRRMGKMS